MADSERASFVFAVSFIIIFAGLFASMPIALFGLGETATTINDIDPNLISDFASSVNFSKSTMTPSLGEYYYFYDLGGFSWQTKMTDTNLLYVQRKITYFGLWFGQLEHTTFVLPNGTSRGEGLSFSEINGDATNGVVRYNLQFTDNSNDAGGFVVYWNSTDYGTSSAAWAASELYLIHGMGVTTPNTNVVALLLGLLTFQIPNIPTLPNLIIVTPIAVCVIFLIWFIVKESLPFW